MLATSLPTAETTPAQWHLISSMHAYASRQLRAQLQPLGLVAFLDLRSLPSVKLSGGENVRQYAAGMLVCQPVAVEQRLTDLFSRYCRAFTAERLPFMSS